MIGAYPIGTQSIGAAATTSVSGSLATTFDSILSAAMGTVATAPPGITGTFNQSLVGIALSATGAAAQAPPPITGTMATTLFDVALSGTGTVQGVTAITPSIRQLYIPGRGPLINFFPKRAVEVEVLTVDFGPLLAPGVTITSAAWSVSAIDGTAPNVTGMIQGAYVVAGTTVSQMLAGGVPGVRYAPICTAQTSDGQTLVLPVYGEGLLLVTL